MANVFARLTEIPFLHIVRLSDYTIENAVCLIFNLAAGRSFSYLHWRKLNRVHVITTIKVAYMIAFLMELWWVWDTGGQVPHLAYILITGYFVTFILSAILVAGITNKKMPHLLLWLFGIVAILIPETGLKIFSIYGLTEITCWACRLIVNIAGLICVSSLYFNWKEEQQVLTSLRDLNMIYLTDFEGPKLRRNEGDVEVGSCFLDHKTT
uniref:Uncharacterized protein n=1 Tax=Rhodnius prolixus TaxID=13249 RepID=T1I4H8_RHOPR